MDIYTPDPETSIIHYLTVDFTKRFVSTPIHLVQYDYSLPVLAITMLQSGNTFALPDNSIALIRFAKYDRTFVILEPLGISSDKTTVYFEVPYQMTVEEGTHNPVVELWIDGKVGASSSFITVIDRNPVQNSQVESLTDYQALVRFKNEAVASAESAEQSRIKAEEVEAALDAGMPLIQSAQSYAENARDSAAEAKGYEESSQQILDSMEQMVDGGLFYVEASALPSVGVNDRTLYGVPSKIPNAPSNCRDIWIYKNGEWILFSGFRGNVVLDDNVAIAPSDWNTTTKEAVKTVNWVTATNKVYAYRTGNDNVYCKSQATNKLTFGLVHDELGIPEETINISIQIIVQVT